MTQNKKLSAEDFEYTIDEEKMSLVIKHKNDLFPTLIQEASPDGNSWQSVDEMINFAESHIEYNCYINNLEPEAIPEPIEN